MSTEAIKQAVETEGGPSLGELIETRRFLGREFLAWVWFESIMFGGKFSGGKFGDCELHFEKSLTLDSADPNALPERAVLTGSDPCGSPEAYEALRQGKLPTKVKATILRGDQQFTFVIEADLSLSSLKLPALLKGEGDEPFYERMGLIEEAESFLDGLFGDFLSFRLDSEAWKKGAVPAMREWMREEEGAACAAYVEMRSR